ncbi:MAG: hypothetical protein ACLFUM_09920 [Spirochaetaceae bacterium]
MEYGDYYGEVRGIEEARLLATAGGRVTEIAADVGDSVTAGQSLGR